MENNINNGKKKKKKKEEACAESWTLSALRMKEEKFARI